MQFGFRTKAAPAPEKHLMQGLDGGVTRGIEMVVTPVLFALLGFWLDGVFGTRPILTVVFFTLALAGAVASVYYRYRAEMDEHEKGKPWTKSPR
ncbi:MAG TPA: AtpZ/AtpI family protein [Acidimicrobiia bacterium]|nr:AtpZ/AtpI family protein [Acidimicrobiia bacterium]